MLRKLIVLMSLLISALSWGADVDHRMTVKERLRISLWTEGLTPRKTDLLLSTKPRLPEEIERSLRKL